MKIGVVLGSFSIGNRPLDMSNLYDNPRGLTGTEIAFIRTIEELRKLDNEVVVFNGVSKLNLDNSFDACINFNEPNLFIEAPKKPYKIIWMMLNDFSFIRPGFDEYTDHYFGVCKQHTEHMKKQCPKPEKWSTLELGCDPDLYEDRTVAGRVVWMSSADRGLHWLLQEWPKVKRTVPDANLKIFYHFNYDQVRQIEANSISPQGGPFHPHIQEMAQRVRYMEYAIKKLQPFGVEHIGSISRNQMVKELNEASVFGFSCDTVAFSEGFSVSTLEAHASYTLPVITSCDCLGGIYKDSGCFMTDNIRNKNNLDQYIDNLIFALSDRQDQRIAKCRKFAQQYTWKIAAEKLNKHIKENI